MKLETFEEGRKLKVTVAPFWISLQFIRTAEDIEAEMMYQTLKHSKLVAEEFENDFPNATKHVGHDDPEKQ